MTLRTSIAGPDLPSHPQPFPIATRIGQMVFSSAIGGDVFAGEDALDREIASAFDNVRKVIAAAGGTPDAIGKVTVYLSDRDLRPMVNPHWERMFPDPTSRPVRHAVTTELAGGRHIQVEFIAVLPDAPTAGKGR